MNPSHSTNPTMSTNTKHRAGISLIEVIASTVLVAAMMAPLAGVMRASNRTVRVAESPTISEELSNAGRWIQNTVQDGVVLQVRRNVLSIRTSGIDGNLRVRNRNLVFEDNLRSNILVEGVRGIEFQQILQSAGSRNIIGIRVQMHKPHPDTGNNVISNTIIALPTQI